MALWPARLFAAATAFPLALLARFLRKGRGVRLPGLPTPYDIIAGFHPAFRRSLLAAMSATAACLIAYLFILSPHGMISRQKVKAMIAEKETELTRMRETNQALRNDIALLAGDTETIESVAREELNLAYPGESVYRERDSGPPAYVLNVSGTPRREN